MTMIKIDDAEWYEDKIWLDNLNIYLDAMEDNDDLVIIVDGKERSGKSLRMRQIGKYCANKLGTTFSNKNIHFDLNEYIDFSIESPEYTVCILDEARNVLNKKRANSKSNVKFTNYLSECAKKRQVHLIAAPAFHDIDKYLINWRAKCVYHLHKWYDKDENKQSGYGLKRGRFTLYINNNSLNKYYDMPYYYPKKWEAFGVFSKNEVFSKEELELYESRKDDNIKNKYHSSSEESAKSKSDKAWIVRFLKFAYAMHKNRNVSRGEIADAAGIDVRNLNQHIFQSGKEIWEVQSRYKELND